MIYCILCDIVCDLSGHGQGTFEGVLLDLAPGHWQWILLSLWLRGCGASLLSIVPLLHMRAPLYWDLGSVATESKPWALSDVVLILLLGVGLVVQSADAIKGGT